jgi:hypothetical protein
MIVRKLKFNVGNAVTCGAGYGVGVETCNAGTADARLVVARGAPVAGACRTSETMAVASAAIVATAGSVVTGRVCDTSRVGAAARPSSVEERTRWNAQSTVMQTARQAKRPVPSQTFLNTCSPFWVPVLRTPMPSIHCEPGQSGHALLTRRCRSPRKPYEQTFSAPVQVPFPSTTQV